MRRMLWLMVAAMLVMTTMGCRRYLYRKPVKRTVEFVPDSLVHNDVQDSLDKQMEESTKPSEVEVEDLNDGVEMPGIPQESDLMQKDNDVDVEKLMREGF